LNLVDVMHDASNEIVLDRGLVGGGKIVHQCPPGVAQSIASILGYALQFQMHNTAQCMPCASVQFTVNA
jgi:hypothetical protein